MTAHWKKVSRGQAAFIILISLNVCACVRVLGKNVLYRLITTRNVSRRYDCRNIKRFSFKRNLPIKQTELGHIDTIDHLLKNKYALKLFIVSNRILSIHD